MKKILCFALFHLIWVNIVLHFAGVVPLPLHTERRWIVDEDGKRVKLACVNWVSHTETVLAEGLSKRPLDQISKKIVATGFNCVRLTWPLTLATDSTLASTTVKKRFWNLGLPDAIAGIQVHNPNFLDLTLNQAFQAVVTNLGDNNVMVVLDNHVTRPGWCCNPGSDGFFGDFSAELWISGLTTMATMFNNTKNVVGLSLRNELRGPRQNLTLWHRYMQKGADAVHLANPKILIIVSGLAFDNDLGFLRQQPMVTTYRDKIVFEVHRFGVSLGQGWVNGNPNVVCGNFINTFMANAGFLLEQGFPLFLSEFGGDQTGITVNDNRFLNCVFGVIADLDLEWALWAIQGSYYLRGAVTNLEEFWGVLDINWKGIRNATYMVRVDSVQRPFHGPGLFEGVAFYNLIYHTSTGLCIQKNSKRSRLIRIGSCEVSNKWVYNEKDRTIRMIGTNLCLQAVGLSRPIKLGRNCTSVTSKWVKISNSRMHLSSKLGDGRTVCMDIGNSYSNNVVVTRPCTCLNDDPACDPASQWFKIVMSRREIRQLR